MPFGKEILVEKKYQIFISSTYTDLVEERKLVQDTILSMYHFPVGMELFSAADEDQWDVIKDTIDSSDYYVLIVAHRYGSVITSGDDAGISYTEKEYRYAKSQGISVLAFLIDSSVSVKPENIEKEHTKSYWRRGIYLVGKKSGKYQIKCTLMCEEYEEPQIEYIDFEVL